MYRSFQPKPKGMTLVELLATMMVLSILLGLLLPAVQMAREAARRTNCSNNARQLGIGTLDYESSRRKFPSNDGLAWTQQIAFQTGEADCNTLALAKASEQEQERLLNLLPRLYFCPSAQIKLIADYPASHYGLNSLLLGRRVSEILDGTSNTLLIGELQPFFGAPWVLGPTVNEIQFGSDHALGSHVTFADGSVRFFSAQADSREFAAILTLAGGEL